MPEELADELVALGAEPPELLEEVAGALEDLVEEVEAFDPQAARPSMARTARAVASRRAGLFLTCCIVCSFIRRVRLLLPAMTPNYEPSFPRDREGRYKATVPAEEWGADAGRNRRLGRLCRRATICESDGGQRRQQTRE